jgi:recombination protein RecT
MNQQSQQAIVKVAGVNTFAQYMEGRTAALSKVAASSVSPQRLVKVAIACVSKTPKLQDCTMQSILRSVAASAELGLEAGGALGEAYLVPFKQTCQLIVGYRGLISLAFRSGHIASIQAREVYESDTFEFELGLEPKLRHIPGDETDQSKIKYAYCVVHLKNGGQYFDVMTRKQIDRIRMKSRSGDSGPWVTDYAEMAKKTVTRRTLKYCPMSVEMAKAIAADTAAETGDLSELGDFAIIDSEFVDEQPTTERKTGVDSVKSRISKDDSPEKAATIEEIKTLSVNAFSDPDEFDAFVREQSGDMTASSESLEGLDGIKLMKVLSALKERK